MKRIIRQPLLHFVLLGVALFVTYRLVNRESAPDRQQIVVSPGQIEHMATTFARTGQRPPTTEEIKGLIDQYVKEEIFGREAMKLGLDQNDTVIRRRLQQKMEFITDDFVSAEEPTDAALGEYLAKHPETFRRDGNVTFRQVFLSSDKHAERLEAAAAQLLTELKSKGAGTDVSEFGDPSLLPPSMTSEPQRAVENTFGREFAAALADAPTSEWSGPIRSGFGLHLVLVENREAERVPELADVREAVKRDWENARRTEASRRFFDDLLRQYQVSIEWPEAKTAAVR